MTVKDFLMVARNNICVQYDFEHSTMETVIQHPSELSQEEKEKICQYIGGERQIQYIDMGFDDGIDNDVLIIGI